MFSTSMLSGMGGGRPQAAQAPQEESKAIVNINGFIDTSKSECQNASSDTPFINILQSSDSYLLKSD